MLCEQQLSLCQDSAPVDQPLANSNVHGAGPKEAIPQAQTLGGAFLLPAAIFTYALQVDLDTTDMCRCRCLAAPRSAHLNDQLRLVARSILKMFNL